MEENWNKFQFIWGGSPSVVALATDTDCQLSTDCETVNISNMEEEDEAQTCSLYLSPDGAEDGSSNSSGNNNVTKKQSILPP